MTWADLSHEQRCEAADMLYRTGAYTQAQIAKIAGLSSKRGQADISQMIEDQPR